MKSQLDPPWHAQLEPLHPHVTPAHVGEAVGPQAAATTKATIIERSMARTVTRVSLRRVPR
jgi:hypothetical protein